MSKLKLSSLYQLTSIRFRLVLREPEAIFWIFIFPILLAVGLGIAFRNRPPDILPVGATTPALTQALAADKGLRAEQMDAAAGAHALATGKILDGVRTNENLSSRRMLPRSRLRCNRNCSTC